VPLTATTANGGKLTLQYRFHRDSYEIDQDLIYDNAGQSKVELRSVPELVSNDKPAGEPQKFLHTFFGLGVYELHDGSYRFEKKDFSDVAKKAYDNKQHGGWIAFLQQYFLGAVIPPASEPVQVYAKPAGDGRVSAGYVGQPVSVAAGGRATLSTSLYIGPKLQDRLDSVAPGLGLTQDYGLFTVIAKPLFWVLSKFHALTGNWGVAIVLLTLLVRGAFFKLSEAQYRSMAKMRKFGPRIKELRERYAGDRERQSKAMMELYKKEGFNPLAGCWPIVIQIPVFIALYWVLAESVELRQAPFMLWMQDLSAPDPYYILPALYALTMFVQQRISGQTATMDPAQQRLMSIMPIGLFGMFAFFPQGLVLYWVVSNSFTLLQQWVIMRRLDREGLGRSG
jgi:membrane protein insertase, YidC/Oxa1 family, C-terminal domain